MTTPTAPAPTALVGAAPAGLNEAQARVWARLNAPQPAREPLDPDWVDMERRARLLARINGDN